MDLPYAPGRLDPWLLFDKLEIESPCDRLIVIARESTPKQRSHLATQVDRLKIELAARGKVCVEAFCAVNNGGDPSWLQKPVERARKDDLPLVGESVCRFIRSPLWHPLNPVATRQQDYRRLKDVVGDVKMFTIVDPRATSEEIRSYETRRGLVSLQWKSFLRSPGYKKRLREHYLPIVMQLVEKEVPVAEIHKIVVEDSQCIETTLQTIYNWIKGVRQGRFSLASKSAERTRGKADTEE